MGSRLVHLESDKYNLFAVDLKGIRKYFSVCRVTNVEQNQKLRTFIMNKNFAHFQWFTSQMKKLTNLSGVKLIHVEEKMHQTNLN